jgi:hypothetical protein
MGFDLHSSHLPILPLTALLALAPFVAVSPAVSEDLIMPLICDHKLSKILLIYQTLIHHWWPYSICEFPKVITVFLSLSPLELFQLVRHNLVGDTLRMMNGYVLEGSEFLSLACVSAVCLGGVAVRGWSQQTSYHRVWRGTAASHLVTVFRRRLGMMHLAKSPPHCSLHNWLSWTSVRKYFLFSWVP